MIRLVLIEDQESFRDFLRISFSYESDFEVVADAASVDDGVEAVQRHGADIVLLDLQIPGGGGFEAVRRIRSRGHQPKIVIFTGSGTNQDTVQALRLLVSGYLLKDIRFTPLAAALRAVHAGEVVVSPEAWRALALEHDRGVQLGESHAIEVPELSSYERQLLQLLSSGCDNPEIAAKLAVSKGTLKRDIRALGAKLGVSNRVELAVLAAKTGLI